VNFVFEDNNSAELALALGIYRKTLTQIRVVQDALPSLRPPIFKLKHAGESYGPHNRDIGKEENRSSLFEKHQFQGDDAT
jgi:hypothetical protein